ncbi:breast cancer anti-estrogen resistance protein 1 isoform X1 [Scophthalmus maximus]|uniref:breast cancer anti-estrogen resistance protein 1 isoform X1 n=1 Tax=Scophthalmus maximus TaxID=52904 RepID=UPI0015E07C7C|nr:breast cancer anti-estrogen resistance protein 1 isoform X1 [Scophthalmus maximus]
MECAATKRNVLAKALYDNVAESPDELSFRKGDIMTVLERDTQGLDGWWLCSLHGRQGIVPGNRLKILVGMYDSKQQQLAATSTPDPATPFSASHVQRPLPPLSAYAKPSPAPSSAATATSSSGFANKPLPTAQYTSKHSAYSTPSPAQPNPDSVYMMPPSHSPKPSPQSLYQIPSGPGGSTPQAQPGPPNKAPALALRQYQLPGRDIYQVPPSLGPGAGQGAALSGGTGAGQDVYQVPPSLEKRNWEISNKPLGKVVVPTRVGQVYVYDTVKSDQDEYDVPPRHQPPTQQDIYDVPPTRQQYNTQVYDTPPMVVKGPTGDQDIYDTPPSTEKNTQQTIYDFPPSVSKDVTDAQPIREETYDVPPHFAKLKPQLPSKAPTGPFLHNNLNDDDNEPPIPEDVYDVPPPILTDKHYHRDRSGVSQAPQDIYDIPASLRSGGHLTQDVYDFPREREERGGERGDNVYDVPPQVGEVVRDAQSTSEELAMSFKRLSASSTGSTRSNHSASSLDMVPVRDTSSSSALPIPGCVTGKPLILDLEQAMERLSRLQQAVESSVSLMMSFITGNWRSLAHLEGNLPAIHQAADRVRANVRDFLEFARGAVANAAQATDRSLQTKLGRQVGKMEEVFQSLVRHSQSLDAISWSHTALTAPPPGGDDLDRLIMTARGIPDDAKQLASFLHGNASLLFKRTNRQQQQQLPLPPIPGEISGHTTGSGSGTYQGGERVHIQSRPLPSPPKFSGAEEGEGVDRPYETTEEGWMEDYDYVHLQGKEEFEKNQKQLLEKGNIIRHNKTQLEQQQIKQFERLEQEVSRPINNDMTGWVPSAHHPHGNQLAQNGSGGPSSSSSKLCHGDRQLLLFYQEQCEQNITTVTNAIDAFFTAVNSNQPPKIFVAHSKFVILSAHKLVFIGDTLSRQAKSPEVRALVAQSSNSLCEKLKDIVISTKTAALQYPSPGAARDMTERVRELAGYTQQFRVVLGQLLGI